ncbi:protein phosphatase CheZ [Alsobacter soli]|uniref:protein phosphatase CheZ n=1 Tax=Alsobacter soli TaxID=2109933 RepID=UPI001304C207|nr:protein phosphatase CheZ [Alsobacter soli]
MTRTTRPYRLEQLGRLGSAPQRPAAEPPRPADPVDGAGHRAAAAAVVEAGAGLGRASAELTAVISDVGRGVHAILGVCEELDAAIHRLRADGALTQEAAEQLTERIVLLFQACDFQDLAGQRIANVRGLLNELDRRITTWRFGAGPAAKAAPEPGRGIPGWGGNSQASELENGPRLQSDAGHLTQAEVDRLLT